MGWSETVKNGRICHKEKSLYGSFRGDFWPNEFGTNVVSFFDGPFPEPTQQQRAEMISLRLYEFWYSVNYQKKVFKSAWISGCYFYSGEGKKLYKGITQDYNTLIYDEEDLRNRLNGVKHRFTEFDYEWDETDPLFADNFRWLNQGNNNLVPVFAPNSQFQLKQLK